MRNWFAWVLVATIAATGCNLIVGNDEHSLADATADSSMTEDEGGVEAAAFDAGPDATVDADARPHEDGPSEDAPPPEDAPSDASGDREEVEAAVAQKSDKGAACTDAGECATGLFCADGVCCDQACGGSCEACDLPMFKGTCSPVLVGQAPSTGHPACTSADASTCGEDGKCDGNGNCELAANGTNCGGSSCSTTTNEVVNGSACDGKGACTPGVAVTCAPFKCASGDTACAKTCSTNSDCVGEPCVNGSCGTVANASTCTSGAQCTSTNCVDGYCCDSACSGLCQACDVAGVQGVCTTVPSGQPHGTRAACAGSGTCKGACTGTASCTYPSATCAVQSCSGSTEMLAASCNGAGSCSTQATAACAGGFACNGSGCYTSCASDAQCAAATPYCNSVGGTCQAKLPQGRSCTTGTQCASGDCVDGYCCNSACGASCQACDVASALGTCTTLTSGQPHGARGACAGSGTCGGSCTGGTSCAYPTSTCASQSCSGGAELLAASCNGAGSCNTQTSSSCGGYACNGTSCFATCTADDQCAAGTPYCSGGACQAKLPQGRTCTAGSQCTSNNCVDGYCCNSACSGQCQACNVTGAQGACTAITSGQPQGGRAACATDGSSCGGACDAGNTASCTYPSSSTGCRSQTCSSGVITLAAACNGSGACATSATESCGVNEVCSGTTCACATGFQSCSGTCVSFSTAANCGACGHSCGSGTCASSTSGACTPFAFVSSGASQIAGLATDGTVVAWADTGNDAIDLVATPGGAVTKLSVAADPTGIALNASTETVLWSNKTSGTWQFGCAKVPPAVNTQVVNLNSTLFPLADQPAGPLSSGALLGWGTSGNEGIVVYLATCGSTSLTMGPSTTTSQSASAPGPAFAETSSAFVFTDPEGGNTWISNGLSSSASMSVMGGMTPSGFPFSMTTDGTYVYFDLFGTGTISRLLPSSPTPTTIYSGSDAAGPVASDGKYVYFATSSGLAYMPVGGGSASLLSSMSSSNIAYASGSLFFNVGTTIYEMTTPL